MLQLALGLRWPSRSQARTGEGCSLMQLLKRSLETQQFHRFPAGHVKPPQRQLAKRPLRGNRRMFRRGWVATLSYKDPSKWIVSCWPPFKIDRSCPWEQQWVFFYVPFSQLPPTWSLFAECWTALLKASWGSFTVASNSASDERFTRTNVWQSFDSMLERRTV